MNRISEKTLLLVLIALVVIFGIFINDKVGDIEDLSNQISNLSVTVNNQNQQINGLYAQIGDLLKKQASIIDSYDITYGAFNSDDMTYEVSFDVTPKESQADTAAAVTLGGLQSDMRRSGTSFSATIKVPVAEVDNPILTFYEEGKSRSETLEDVISFQDNYLHKIKYDFSGEKSYRDKQLHYDGELFIFSVLSGGSVAEAGRVLAMVNDKETWTKEIPVDSQKNNIKFNETFSVGPGDTFALYVEIRDVSGITYRYPMDGTVVSADGQSLSENYLPDQCTVYDKNGKEIKFE